MLDGRRGPNPTISAFPSGEDHCDLSDSSLTVTITAAANTALGATDIFVQNLGTGGGPNSGAMGQCSKCLTIK